MVDGIDPADGSPHRTRDCLIVGLATVDDNAVRTAVTLQSLAQEAFSRRQITMFAEPEVDRVANAVDRTVEIHPLAADLDVGLVHMPLDANSALAAVEALQQ